VPARVAHVIPGRLRLAFAPEAVERGRSLARRLQAHPQVRAVTWNPAARSLTIEHDAAIDARELLRTLPRAGSRRRLPTTSGGIAWGRVMRSYLPCLLPLGPVTGLLLTFLVTTLEHVMAPERPAPGPGRRASNPGRG